MSEVDRLSNSGLYPALPIADQRSRKDGSSGQPPADKRPAAAPAEPMAPTVPDPNQPRPPKSLIDEYA
ncbi:MAG: hypothetical protein ACLQT5_00305 [Steroidobacteraceae bacterium]|jgi:hypothetical protein